MELTEQFGPVTVKYDPSVFCFMVEIGRMVGRFDRGVIIDMVRHHGPDMARECILTTAAAENREREKREETPLWIDGEHVTGAARWMVDSVSATE